MLPWLTHYNRPLDPTSIGMWLRDRIRMSAYMVHAYFQPYLRCVHNTPIGDCYSVFSPTQLYPNEAVTPTKDDSLPDFPADRDWTPNRSPKGHLMYLSSSSVMGATATASLAPLTSHNKLPLFSIHSDSIDANMTSNEEATASTSPASS